MKHLRNTPEVEATIACNRGRDLLRLYRDEDGLYRWYLCQEGFEADTKVSGDRITAAVEAAEAEWETWDIQLSPLPQAWINEQVTARRPMHTWVWKEIKWPDAWLEIEVVGDAAVPTRWATTNGRSHGGRQLPGYWDDHQPVTVWPDGEVDIGQQMGDAKLSILAPTDNVH